MCNWARPGPDLAGKPCFRWLLDPTPVPTPVPTHVINQFSQSTDSTANYCTPPSLYASINDLQVLFCSLAPSPSIEVLAAGPKLGCEPSVAVSLTSSTRESYRRTRHELAAVDRVNDTIFVRSAWDQV